MPPDVSTQKAPAGAPLYSRWVNRPIGRVLAAGAYRVGLWPNQVTAISAVCSFAAIAVMIIAPVSVPIGLLIMVGLVLGYALDSADGQLARRLGAGSVAGEWLDHIVDCLKITSLHLAVLVAFYRHFSLPDWALAVPIIFTVAAVGQFFGMILNEQLARVRRLRLGLGATLPPSTSKLWVSVVRVPVDYGVLCLIFLGYGWPQLFFVAYTVLCLACVGHLALLLPKWFRDMRALDRLSVAPTTAVRGRVG